MAGEVVRLGQNFLADSNLLEAIVRAADPMPDQVVLEIGGGEGALSALLAPRVGHLHIVEIDQRLRQGLQGLAAEHAAIELHFGDAMRLDLGEFSPPPSAMIANLPYSVAAPLLLETIRHAGSIERWTVMVQREIAERFRARVGTRIYGAPSAIAQVGCEARMLRSVNPAVFTPRPRVESAILQIRRTGPAPSDRVCDLIRDAFSHRRKALPRALELAVKRREADAKRAHAPSPRPRSGEIRHAAIEALRRLGIPPEARAETLGAEDFVRLAAEIHGA